MLNFTSIMIGATDPKKMAEFYQPIFNVEPGWTDPDNGWYGYKIGVGSIMVGPHSEVSGKNKEPGRIMFTLEADDPQKEFDRIKALGAKVVREMEMVGTEDMGGLLGTFEDTEGNYFQISTSWEE
jgi:predicted enzyme related to lactoylglutathione lyase